MLDFVGNYYQNANVIKDELYGEYLYRLSSWNNVQSLEKEAFKYGEMARVFGKKHNFENTEATALMLLASNRKNNTIDKIYSEKNKKYYIRALQLWKNKIDAHAVHSKMSQTGRRENLEAFKSGKLRVLVTTDLLARGIDIDFLPCVINYELPRSPKDYIHRIGRTGRAGSPGDAISLISPDEMHHFRVIQKKTGKRVKMLHSQDIDLHGY